MKTGTKSLLFGVHQVFVHPVVVYLAWKHLYGRPSWKELICIIIHDWGYWGKPDLDGVEGEKHPEFAARLATKLFGERYGRLCLYHSRHYAKNAGVEPSKLCWADKLSIAYEPAWFYLLRARLSGELKEMRQTSHNSGFLPIWETDRNWFNKISAFMVNMGIEQKDSKLYFNNHSAHGKEAPLEVISITIDVKDAKQEDNIVCKCQRCTKKVCSRFDSGCQCNECEGEPKYDFAHCYLPGKSFLKKEGV